MIALLLAATAAAPAGLPPGPIEFSAQDMRFELKDRRVLYLDGDVHLKRGDLAVVSDHAIANLAAEKPKPKPPPKGKKKKQAATPMAAGQEIEKFTVDGNVHVTRGTRTADGDHGVVDMPAQTMVLTGTDTVPPVLHDGKETLEGDRILLHTDSDDVDVQKPRLVLHRAIKSGKPSEKPEKTAEPATPMRVDAEHLVLHNQERLARFTEDVVVHRGDAVMRSPKMDAHYDKDGELTVLNMRGGVDMRQGDRRATGKTADYDAKARVMTLLGDPKLYDRGDVLAGDRIEVALDSSEVRVQKGKAHLRPELHREETASPATGGARTRGALENEAHP
ncbi:MAG TPA: LptA/OstA family protein [Myxococcales bacterium]|nr:LptA/OstA family protein [Myxococcales bacterium]